MLPYEPVIGLETHIQLNTQSKIFCSCSADSWGAFPNTNICPVCCGLPGVLPALNQAVVEKAILLAGAMHAETIQPVSYLARKNYFYPDLPKGYQISQYDEPLARGGWMDLPLRDGRTVRVNITKLHFEEDAGKTKVDPERNRRLIDFNRCGVPLVEMVTGPDLHSADEAAQYIIRLRQLLRWLDISEANMEKAHLRIDANVSIRRPGETHLNPKTEIKNVNSIESVRTAIETEVQRQIRAVESGGRIEPWTLEWDEERGTLSVMRTKETEADYRYFREPDLLPVRVDPARRDSLVRAMPELPLDRRARFLREYGLPEYDAEILTEERSLSDYFEAAVKAYEGEPKAVSNWVMNDVLRELRERNLSAGELLLTPAYLADMIKLVEAGAININTGKSLIPKVIESGRSPRELVEAEGLGQISGEEVIRQVAVQVLAANPDQVAAYQSGKTTLLQWFVGQVMKQTRGKANAQAAARLLEELLKD